MLCCVSSRSKVTHQHKLLLRPVCSSVQRKTFQQAAEMWAGVPEDKVMPCIECWCQDERITARGKFGGGACCSSSLCPSMLPNTTETTYLLQYNVSYR